MFAGKSTFMINTASKLDAKPEEILIINHKFDKRYSEDSKICSHDGQKMNSIALSNLSEIFNIDLHSKYHNFHYDINKIRYIFIDESQFFEDLYDVIYKLLFNDNSNNINYIPKEIYISGLDLDYKQQPFLLSRMTELEKYAKHIHRLTARCSICNESAQFTKRISQSNEQIYIGGANEYQPVCKIHLI